MNYKHYLLAHKKLVTSGLLIVALILIGIVWYISSAKSSDLIALDTGSGKSNDSSNQSGEIQTYDYKKALDHIGEKAKVKGTVLKVFTSKSGVTFFDFCAKSSSCPFSAVIFASDLKKFGDVTKYEKPVTITGIIKSYKGSAEIVLNDPGQIE